MFLGGNMKRIHIATFALLILLLSTFAFGQYTTKTGNRLLQGQLRLNF